jgi:hypothetical protein
VAEAGAGAPVPGSAAAALLADGRTLPEVLLPMPARAPHPPAPAVPAPPGPAPAAVAELLFVVAQFLAGTPCRRAYEALVAELDAHRLLPTALSWTGAPLPLTYADLVRPPCRPWACFPPRPSSPRQPPPPPPVTLRMCVCVCPGGHSVCGTRR